MHGGRGSSSGSAGVLDLRATHGTTTTDHSELSSGDRRPHSDSSDGSAGELDLPTTHGTIIADRLGMLSGGRWSRGGSSSDSGAVLGVSQLQGSENGRQLERPDRGGGRGTHAIAQSTGTLNDRAGNTGNHVRQGTGAAGSVCPTDERSTCRGRRPAPHHCARQRARTAA